jgi:hypothetical protein
LAEGRSRRDGGGKVSMRGGGEVPMRCDAKAEGRLLADAKERGARGGRRGEGADARMTEKRRTNFFS